MGFFFINKLYTYCSFTRVPILVSLVTTMFMPIRYYYYYYYYYYCPLNNLFKPEHEYKRLQSNSMFVWENIPSLHTVGNMVPLKSLPIEIPWRVFERWAQRKETTQDIHIDPNRKNVMQSSKIISRPSSGVTRERHGVWNGNRLHWTLIVINDILLWRCSQLKPIQFTIESTGCSQYLSRYQFLGTGFKRRTFRSWFPGLLPRHWIRNSYARMQWNAHCTNAIRPRGHPSGNITVLSTRYHGKATATS
jgi:hypothetical protein